MWLFMDIPNFIGPNDSYYDFVGCDAKKMSFSQCKFMGKVFLGPCASHVVVIRQFSRCDFRARRSSSGSAQA